MINTKLNLICVFCHKPILGYSVTGEYTFRVAPDKWAHTACVDQRKHERPSQPQEAEQSAMELT